MDDRLAVVCPVNRISVNTVLRNEGRRGAKDRDGSFGEQKTNVLRFLSVGLRTCTVSCCDLKGVEHAIEITADSLYEAVAQGLRALRENEWVDDIGRGQTTVTVVVRQPGVEHKVRIREFERWLESQGRTPAEMSLKSRLRELMRRESGKV